MGQLAALGIECTSAVEHVQLQGLHQGSPAWHAARACRITASDVPSAVGIPGAYLTPEQLVAAKLSSSTSTTAAMQHGIDNEPVAAEAYKQVLLASHPPGSSVDIEETGFWVHARMPHIGASPDRRVRMVVNGSEQPIRHVQIKCPHSKPLESFKELPDMVAFQVITELAVLRSHKAAGTPAAIDVFVWKADEEPVLHTITWEDVRQRWFTKILPKVNAFYFRLLQPQLNKRIRMRQQQAAVLHHGGPTAAQQSTSSQVTPMKLSLIAELQLDAAARMAATAAAAAVLEAAARVADASLMSPIKVTSPAFREGKRVLHKRTIKQGTVESVSGDQVMVAWDEDATGGLPDGEPVRKAKRRRATAAANLSIIPVDVSSSKYGELIGKHEGEPVVVISGKYAGELGVCGVQTGQNYRVMLSGSTQSVSIAASQLRRKIAQDEGVERCTSQHSKVIFTAGNSHDHMCERAFTDGPQPSNPPSTFAGALHHGGTLIILGVADRLLRGCTGGTCAGEAQQQSRAP